MILQEAFSSATHKQNTWRIFSSAPNKQNIRRILATFYMKKYKPTFPNELDIRITDLFRNETNNLNTLA